MSCSTRPTRGRTDRSVLPYSSFSQLAQEEADSRIYRGIHFRFDNEVSRLACDKLVMHAYDSVMRPR